MQRRSRRSTSGRRRRRGRLMTDHLPSMGIPLRLELSETLRYGGAEGFPPDDGLVSNVGGVGCPGLARPLWPRDQVYTSKPPGAWRDGRGWAWALVCTWSEQPEHNPHNPGRAGHRPPGCVTLSHKERGDRWSATAR